MSQQKVDKKKYEKYHRKEMLKKKKIKTVCGIIIACIVIGTAIGVPLGYKIYKSIPKKIESGNLETWVSHYMQNMDGYPFVTPTTEEASSEDASAEGETSEETSSEGETSEETSSEDEAGETSESSEASESESTEASETEEASSEAETTEAASEEASSEETEAASTEAE